MSENWKKIDDEKILHRWECPDCGDVTYVYPWFYRNSGTPVCDMCGEDMEYIHTEMNLG